MKWWNYLRYGWSILSSNIFITKNSDEDNIDHKDFIDDEKWGPLEKKNLYYENSMKNKKVDYSNYDKNTYYIYESLDIPYNFFNTIGTHSFFIFMVILLLFFILGIIY